MVTGTSDIGCTNWKIQMGLVASRNAADRPAAPPARRRAMTDVSHTPRAPSVGTTRPRARAPPSQAPSASCNGNPGG